MARGYTKSRAKSANGSVRKHQSGSLTVFIQHTSASLLIQENADPDVRRDLCEFFERMVPENTPWFRHTISADTTCRHIRAALTSVQLDPGDGRATRTRHVAGNLRVRASVGLAASSRAAAYYRRVKERTRSIGRPLELCELFILGAFCAIPASAQSIFSVGAIGGAPFTDVVKASNQNNSLHLYPQAQISLLVPRSR